MIRRIHKVLDGVLAEFDAMYATTRRQSVPSEQLLKATVLMAKYSIGSKRSLCEWLNDELLFKWFRDLPIDAKRSTRQRSRRTANQTTTQTLGDRASTPESVKLDSAPSAVTLHWLRHSYVTMLLTARVPLKVVSERIRPLLAQRHDRYMPGVDPGSTETLMLGDSMCRVL
jgi:hypothetical protein